jgi:mono/diheme cytochrome c family protein
VVRRLVIVLALLALAGGAGFWFLTEPAVWRALRAHGTDEPSRGVRNLTNGEELFWAGGCPACHVSPGQDDRTRLGGGTPLPSPFGTFYPPNISPDPKDGIGAWSQADFIRAMREGVSPEGRNYYPAFPYTSYQHLAASDLADIFAFMQTLPAVQGRAPDHDLPFPYNLRRGVGLWKLAFLSGEPIRPEQGKSAGWNRGRYLVEGAAHCAECHSRRGFAGNVLADTRFGGGPNPEGKGTVPNITPDPTGIGSWSAADIADLLKTGFTPDYDAVGGSMAPVVKNTAHLTDADRAAMAEYLKSVPPVKSEKKTPKAE